MEVLIFFTTLWLLWLISSRWWKRKVILPLAIIGLIYIFITSPIMLALASQGLTFSIPQDTGENVDAIVVLGRGTPLRSGRVEVAAELWKNKRAPIIFVSGMLDAEETIEQLEKQGIPKSKMSGERCSQTTEENVQFTTAILYPQGIQKILLLTDFPHLLRAKTLFQNYGFKVIPQASSLPSQWSTIQRLKIVLREYAGLIHYYSQGYFRPRNQEEIANPSEKVSDRLKNWNCQVNNKQKV